MLNCEHFALGKLIENVSSVQTRLTFRVLDNLGVVRLHDGDAGVRSAEIDADNAVTQDKKKCEVDDIREVVTESHKLRGYCKLRRFYSLGPAKMETYLKGRELCCRSLRCSMLFWLFLRRLVNICCVSVREIELLNYCLKLKFRVA